MDDRIDRIYEDLPTTFPNMNSLLTELLNRGLKSLENDIYNKKDPEDLSALLDEIKHTTNTLHILMNVVQDRFKEITISNRVLQKLAGCNYSLLVGINSGNPKEQEYVDKGFYDKLPDRFESIIEELLKHYK